MHVACNPFVEMPANDSSGTVLGSAQAQGNLAEYYGAFFVLFAVLEFNKVVGSTTLNGLGIWYVFLY